MMDKSIRDLDDLLADITGIVESRPGDLGRVRPSISAWSVAQQLDHILKVCSAMLNGLIRPGATPPRGINWIGRAILLFGRIPRGRAKAPERMRGVDATAEQLALAVEDTRRLLGDVRSDDFRPANVPVVRHPFFGGLNPSQSLRSAVVHTRHHLRIVSEILAAH
jgi:hypothetical protein